MATVDSTQLLLNTARDAMSDSFPCIPYPTHAASRVDRVLSQSGVAGTEFSQMKTDGERAFRLHLAVKIHRLLPPHLLDQELIVVLSDTILTGLANGTGSTTYGTSPREFFLAVIESLGHGDERWCPEFIDQCLAGVWTALSNACKDLPVVHGPPVAVSDRETRVDALASHIGPQQMASTLADLAALADTQKRLDRAIKCRRTSKRLTSLHPLPPPPYTMWKDSTATQLHSKAAHLVGSLAFDFALTTTITTLLRAHRVTSAQAHQLIFDSIRTDDTLHALAMAARHTCPGTCPVELTKRAKKSTKAEKDGDEKKKADAADAFLRLLGVASLHLPHGMRALKPWMAFALGELVKAGVQALALPEPKARNTKRQGAVEPTPSHKRRRTGLADVTNVLNDNPNVPPASTSTTPASTSAKVAPAPSTLNITYRATSLELEYGSKACPIPISP
ncbi:hypothetical protein C8R46DRAFT_1228383 [Mycena filopes]|nr:hypothetical protein C8R46DRAFT_1228383 [Mycena filopes]